MTKVFRLSSNSLFPVRTSNRNCPVCKAPDVNRVKRRIVDRLISPLIPIKRYHCEVCGWAGNLKINGE